MNKLIIKILLLILLINFSNGDVFSINADKCTNIGCTFGSLFTSKLPQITDDVVFFTSNPLIQSIIILSDQISINSLNVTNGILKISSSGKLSVTSNILISSGGSLMLDGNSQCSSLQLNGNLYVNTQSTLTVSASLNIGLGSVFESNGTLSIGNLIIQSGLTSLPKFFGNAQITLNGNNSTFSSGIQLLDNANLIIGQNAICQIKSLISTVSTASIQNKAKLIFDGITNSDLKCKLNLAANSITQFISSKINLNSFITTTTSQIQCITNTLLTIHNCQSTLGSINLDASSQLILDKSQFTIASLTSMANSLIKLTNSSQFSIDQPFTFNNDFNLDGTSSIVVISTKTQLITFNGKLITADGSLLNLNWGCTFNNPISIDKLLIGANSILTFMKNSTIIKDVTCPSTASIVIDKTSGSLTIGGYSNLDINVLLEGSSKLNIVASTNITVNDNSLCTIKQITQSGSNSILNIGTNVNLNILQTSTFLNPIQLNGNANLHLNGDVTLNGLIVFPIENTQLPTLQFSNSNCSCDSSNSDFDIIGTVKLVKSTLSLLNTCTLNINNNLITDSDSSINIPVDATLIVGGPSSVISSTLKIDGKLNLEKGSINFNNGLSSTVASFITCNNANVQINGQNNLVDIDGQFSITGQGQLNINSSKTIFRKGIKCPTAKSPINISDKTNVTILTDSLISSPIYCFGSSILNFASNSRIQLDGGLSSEINSILNLESSTFSLNSTSNILGLIKLNNSTIISSGATKISNSISSDLINTNNNLLINGGSCLIDSGKNLIDISGQINILKDSLLTIKSYKTQCKQGIKNLGKIILSGIVDTLSSTISQTSGDAELVLLSGSNLISKTLANLQSGKISGNGTISSNNVECGGVIGGDNNGGSLTVNGNLKLLDSAVITVNINSINNFSQILCNGNITANGLIEITLNSQATLTLKKGDLFTILKTTCPCESSSQSSNNTNTMVDANITGDLTLSDTSNSKSFTCEKSQSGTSYNLIYQDTQQPNTGKQDESTDDHSSVSIKLSTSIYSLLILLIFTILI